MKRFAGLLCILALVAIGVSAQGLDTKASKDDWEEINFEFNSSVLVDGFPSLLRLAELLQKNPGYKVKLEGHTDIIGNNPYNDRLGMARANMVRDFLVKYGARPNQIDVTTRGKVDPKYPGQKPTYTKTDEARWMNRRVVMTVTDDQGRTVSAAGVGDAIRAMEPKPQAGMTDCCTEVLKRLDKLDDIAKLLQNLADQNAQLRRDMDALKQAQQVLESKANQPQSGPPAVTPQQVEQAVTAAIDRSKEPKFQTLGVNLGMDQNGDLTATGKGRFFGPFGEHYAFQAQGEFLYFKGQREGQADFGLVDRIGRFQAGLFSSFKHVSLSAATLGLPAGSSSVPGGGTLGQAAFTLDYLFKWGKLGLFGTYAFLDNALVNSQAAILANGIVSPDLMTNTYLRVVNQAGASFTVGLWGRNYLEGNIGYLKSYVWGDRAGGSLRFIFPINNRIALTAEGDLNPSILGPSNNAQALFGVQFGNAIRPKDYLSVTHPVPVDVPDVRYEVVHKLVRTGHSPPVADAGPDQIGVPAGSITLNASASYSPDGLPITFKWVQQAGPAVTLSSQTSPITTFSAASGQAYIFEVIVTDSLGGQGTARVHITTTSTAAVQILFFTATPNNIQTGQSSTLAWNVVNATSVTVSSIGSVSSQGSQSVSPTVTTTYTLTASNSIGSQTAMATVTVGAGTPKLLYCYATPTNITLGESATLNWQSQNATSVSISNGVGTVALSGNAAVTPTTTTNYIITATGGAGTVSDTCSVAVTVSAGTLPRIIRFSAAPATINSGQTSTLFWVVENATTVTINNNIGNVSLGGSQDVSPAATTTYQLTATNAAGSVTALATVNVNVIAPPVITSFTAVPNPSPSPGSPVVLSCQTTGAVSITMAGILFLPGSATYTEHPTTNTTYTCIATGAGGQTTTQTVNVTVTQAGGGGGSAPPVIVIAGGNTVNTILRFLTIDASGTYSPSGNTPLTYQWSSVNNSVAILNSTSPTPNIQLGEIGGVYQINLTVTDSKGNTANATVTINFLNVKVQDR